MAIKLKDATDRSKFLEQEDMATQKDLEKGCRTSPAPFGAQSEGLKDLLGRASILEEHRALLDTVIGRISSVESGLYEAARSLLTGFEVRKKVYLLVEPHIECALYK